VLAPSLSFRNPCLCLGKPCWTWLDGKLHSTHAQTLPQQAGPCDCAGSELETPHSNSTLWLKEGGRAQSHLSACIKLGAAGRLSPHQDAANEFFSGMHPMIILTATLVVPTVHLLPTRTDATATPAHHGLPPPPGSAYSSFPGSTAMDHLSSFSSWMVDI